ncbi:MAG: SAM-dependent methyltransferase [Pseudonocardia sp.]|nr:SAM-dependent methyltransferase [Pseudonocardia sp.]
MTGPGRMRAGETGAGVTGADVTDTHAIPGPRQAEPGSPVCPPGWLALREPADAAARAPELVERLRGYLGGHLTGDRTVVRDLGCGTGSMGRWLAGRLSADTADTGDTPDIADPAGTPDPAGTGQHWVLHDRDTALLERAVASLPDGITAETCAGDLTGLDAARLAGTSLVTASALLDLLTADEVEDLAEACTGAGCPALLTLSVTGSVWFAPSEPLDDAFAAAFDAHQRRVAGGRALLGPDAADTAAAAFRRRGAAVVVAPSPWRLDPDRPGLIEAWLRGRLAAACAQRPELGSAAGAYLRRRLGALADGELAVVVGHADLLALPPADPATGGHR